MRVFLIHGMGRSPSSLALLGRRLRAAGHAPSSFGYQVARESIDRIAGRYVAHVTKVVEADGGGPYAVVGHSLGNVITRYAAASLPPGFARFVMLAPPNRSPALARAMRGNTVFRALTRDAGDKLGQRAFFEALPVPNVPTLVIAGVGNPPWLPHRDIASDGIVAIEETRLPGARHETVESTHTFIMNNAEAVRLLLEFLSG